VHRKGGEQQAILFAGKPVRTIVPFGEIDFKKHAMAMIGVHQKRMIRR
jgi:hypothetical protein